MFFGYVGEDVLEGDGAVLPYDEILVCHMPSMDRGMTLGVCQILQATGL